MIINSKGGVYSYNNFSSIPPAPHRITGVLELTASVLAGRKAFRALPRFKVYRAILRIAKANAVYC